MQHAGFDTGDRGRPPVVLLVDCLGGPELEIVHDILVTSLDTPSILLGPAEVAAAPVALDVRSGLVTLPDGPTRPAVTWVRHAGAGTLLAQPTTPHVSDPLGAAYWSDLLDHLGGAATAHLPGPHPSRIGQLRDAAAAGFRTPHSVVTTDVAVAAAVLDAPRLIVKRPDFRVLVGDRTTWPARLPRIVDRATVIAHPGPSAEPVLVQEYLDDATELRVYLLDGSLCTFRVDKDGPGAPWTEPNRVEVTSTACPDQVAALVRRLAAGWGLCYAAFDILLPPKGEPVFLEANPDGDWVWFERRAGWHGVSLTAAAMVADLYLRTAPRGVSVG